MSAIETILSRIPNPREVGKGRWMACCPAHEDSSPSLSIREMPDGRVLIYDFGGCSTQEVMDSLNLTLSDLFDTPLGHHYEPIRGGFSASELLMSIEHESFVACLILEDAGENVLSEGALKRLRQAQAALGQARVLAFGR